MRALLVRGCAIAWASVLYFLWALCAAWVLKQVSPGWDGLPGVLVYMAYFGVAVALGKRVVERAPFPLDGHGGFSYRRSRVWEETGVAFVGLGAYTLPDLHRFVYRS
jgi:hypothetical protein